MERRGDSRRINSGVRDPPSFPILHPSRSSHPFCESSRLFVLPFPVRESGDQAPPRERPQSPSISASVWIIRMLPTSHRQEARERGRRKSEKKKRWVRRAEKWGSDIDYSARDICALNESSDFQSSI